MGRERALTAVAGGAAVAAVGAVAAEAAPGLAAAAAVLAGAGGTPGGHRAALVKQCLGEMKSGCAPTVKRTDNW